MVRDGSGFWRNRDIVEMDITGPARLPGYYSERRIGVIEGISHITFAVRDPDRRCSRSCSKPGSL